MQVGCSKSIGPEFSDSEMCGSVGLKTSCLLTSSAGDSLVNRTVKPESDRGKQIHATCGRSSPVSFASLGRDGYWLKTCRGYSQLTLDQSSEKFCETWPRAGMMWNGTAYRLSQLVPLTDVIGCSSLPTPVAGPCGTNRGGGAGRAGKVRPSLETMARKNLWPTPTVGDSKSARNSTANRQSIPPTGIHKGNTLTDAVTMWPAPTASRLDMDTLERARFSGQALKRMRESGEPYQKQTGGQLNPTWVEWLMGFPPGWTDLDASGTP